MSTFASIALRGRISGGRGPARSRAIVVIAT
jgi:hypothetical protein